MPANYPYYTEPTHDRGTVTIDANNAARTTAVSSAEGRLIIDIVDKIFLLEPNKHPLVSLLTNVGKVYDGKSWKGSGMMKAATGNPEFKWLEDYYGGRYARVGAAYTTGAITMTVTGAGTSSANIFTAGDVIMNARTEERMLVDARASTTTLTIGSTSRAFGTTAEAAGVAGDGIYIVGNVNEENANARNVNVTRSAAESNYTQIFKTSIAVSNTEKEANLYGGKDLPYLRAKMGTQHALDIERAFWFSEKKSDTTGTQGHPRKATGGIDEFIQGGNSYIQNQGGPITAPDFNTFLRESFTYGNPTKVMFCGGLVLQAINEIARGQLRDKPVPKTYGVKISEWVTAFGTVNLIHNPMFMQDFAGSAYLLDMECFKYRFMNNRDTKLLTNVQANDTDGQIDQYVSEVGLQRMQAPRHSLLKGVTN